MAPNGPPQAALISLGSYSGSLNRIWLLRALKKWPEHTQNSTRSTGPKLSKSLIGASKMAPNGPQWPPMALHSHHQFGKVLHTPSVYDKGPLGPQKVTKTHSEQLQNDFQGPICPLVLPQNGPQWPQMAPKGYPQYTRVMFWVTVYEKGTLGP